MPPSSEAGREPTRRGGRRDPRGPSGERRGAGRGLGGRLPFTAIGPVAVIVHGVLIMVCVSVIIPLFLMISGSFTDEQVLSVSGVSFIPRQFSGAAYEYVFRFPTTLLQAYGVTATITLIGTVVSLLLTTMLAYVLSRRDYFLSRVTTFVVFFTLLFNGGLVPFYILVTRYLHLENTIGAMIVPNLVAPFTVLIAKGYMARLNFEVIEAAKVDGASEYRIFFSIVLPMIKPATATLGVLISFAYWNEWFNALLFVSNKNLYPLQLFVYNLASELSFLQQHPEQARLLLGLSSAASVPYISAELAMTILAVAPFVVVFSFLQRYFREGLTVGSLKG